VRTLPRRVGTRPSRSGRRSRPRSIAALALACLAIASSSAIGHGGSGPPEGARASGGPVQPEPVAASGLGHSRGALGPAGPTGEWTSLPDEGTGPTPNGELGGSLVYDDAAGEYVYFGGCASVCPTNITWTFANDSWHNVTATRPAPSPRYYAGMDYDGRAGGVLLFGGVDAAGGDLSDTWLFRNGTWTEVNRTGPTPRDAPVQLFDPAPSINATVLFGGCTVAAPPVCFNDTWTWTPSVGWVRLAPAAAPSARGFAFGAFDPAAGAAVLFGGVGPCAESDCDFADTWQFASGGWSEIRVSGPLPSARYDGAATYDAAASALLVYGGYNLTEDSTDGDSWLFNGTGWAAVAPSSLPGERGDPALASGGVEAPPLLYGGGEDDAPSLPTDTCAFVAPLELTVGGVPPVTDLGAQRAFNVTAVGGTPPFSYSATWGGQNSSGAGAGPTFEVPASFALGPVLIAVSMEDALGFNSSGNLEFDVVPPPAVSIVIAQNVTDVGLPLGFLSVNRSTGVTPLSLTWSFGDGSTAVGEIVTHAYTTTGSFVVTLAATDAIGETVTAQVPIQILPDPSVNVSVSGPSIAGRPLNFSSSATGGDPPYFYAWRFGDGGASTIADPVHTFDSPGNYTVQLWINDSLGATAYHALPVHVAAANASRVTPPTARAGSSSPVPVWVWASVGVGAVVVGAAVLLLRRHRRM
jgi:PKD domain-containing protein